MNLGSKVQSITVGASPGQLLAMSWLRVPVALITCISPPAPHTCASVIVAGREGAEPSGSVHISLAGAGDVVTLPSRAWRQFSERWDLGEQLPLLPCCPQILSSLSQGW